MNIKHRMQLILNVLTNMKKYPSDNIDILLDEDIEIINDLKDKDEFGLDMELNYTKMQKDVLEERLRVVNRKIELIKSILK